MDQGKGGQLEVGPELGWTVNKIEENSNNKKWCVGGAV